MAGDPETVDAVLVDVADAAALMADATLPTNEAAGAASPGTADTPMAAGGEGAPATAEPVDADAVSPAPEDGSADDAVPDFWADADKGAWAKVPADLRAVLARYERQRADSVAETTRRAGEERDAAVRAAEAAHALVAQSADWWRHNGLALRQAFADRWSRIDWKALAEKDPAEVGRLMQQRQDEEALLAEAARVEARRAEEGKLASRLPDWFGTPPVAERTWGELRRYLFAKGIAADRIEAVHEAPIVEIALNAMRFENAQALAQRVRQRSRNGSETARAAAGPAAASPVRVSPGPAHLPGDRAPEAARAVGDRFRRSGGASIADAAELIRLSDL
ncbi:hypothetical protein [Reyranella sp.]|uniref:hypothetical protein n=1 Tax=Reyranella sp. TaxID=1929291 RepID=UPI003BABDD38